MKKLIALILVTSITIISWSSCAKSTVIQVNNLYIQPPISTKSISLKPFLSTNHANEAVALSASKVIESHNEFFEITVKFNEKLQQLFSFIDNSYDEIKEVAINNAQSLDDNMNNNQKCKSNS